jgi:enoyl-CoA hydratase/carnithine racemase
VQQGGLEMLTSEELSGRGTLRSCRRGAKNSILLVALTRLRVNNAFNDDVYEDLIDVLHWTSKDSSIAAIVLTGSGPYFSSGADLKGNTYSPEQSGRQTLHKPAGRFMLALIAYPKIIAAAVNGPAVGIATTLLMHCDLVHCVPTATFWAPFTRLALVPELCSSATFYAAMGLSKANELLLLGKKIDAATALQWNICSQIVSNGAVGADCDPFDSQSLASHMCRELDQKLLSLPAGDKTAQYFVSMVKGARRVQMEQICREELYKLDERFDTGQVSAAASALKIGSAAKNEAPQSRL